MKKKAGERVGAGGKKTAVPINFPLPPEDLLSEGLKKLEIPEHNQDFGKITVNGRETLGSLFEAYLKELVLFNSVFNLIGADTDSAQGRSDLVVRHILDALSPWRILAEKANDMYTDASFSDPVRIADAGSGAGIPGIPLAILFPGIRFTLIERMSRRCTFLENCAALLGLENVTVLNTELEKAPGKMFDFTVFRAFRPLDASMLKILTATIKPRGMLAAYKARINAIREEMSGVEALLKEWNAVPLQVPFLEHEERFLVLMR
ncbi:16S rRNA (guanine(527)-N(7))-methyltransferase RsmG [Brucepastera parasyntrophica]|uniref:16S rRNA (guanine(527)-N(7))-methyltransferase RsmG n=1 Tax=Brucepastera parasyntrophica TaxID=2880008 RepID=UPI00210C7EF5|nr:16S rRNA (guanine(527)-N(7))-methyltransferase RsmG [Brucepastera parasyntrophica]ULQ60944.1 16S rRNA (guanine(527)-N(7))-methyltransferase RsmG [Brucepastera parasyntrophica]